MATPPAWGSAGAVWGSTWSTWSGSVLVSVTSAPVATSAAGEVHDTRSAVAGGTWGSPDSTWNGVGTSWSGIKPLNVSTAAAVTHSILVSTRPAVTPAVAVHVDKWILAGVTSAPVSTGVAATLSISVSTSVPVTVVGPMATMTAWSQPVVTAAASMRIGKIAPSGETPVGVVSTASAFVMRPQVTFEGPWYVTRDESELWIVKEPVGITLYQKQDGSWVQTTSPIDSELIAAQRVYRGGYSYPVSDADVAVLTAAGYGSFINTRYVRV